MDGNGRWAKQRGLPRTEGHKAGEYSLFDVIMGAIELGIPYLSAYAFSTENWRRSPDEVRFLMGFNRDVIRRRRDQLNEMGVRVRWAGRRPRLWRSVISELEDAERMTAGNSVLTLQFCVNYGGRAEIADAAAAIAADVAAGKLRADKIDEKVFARYLDEPGIPDVDLFVRSSGEQRTSNFLIWQSAYAEFVFLDTLFPDFDRRHLWQACEIYASRDRRYGGAEPNRIPDLALSPISASWLAVLSQTGRSGAVQRSRAGRGTTAIAATGRSRRSGAAGPARTAAARTRRPASRAPAASPNRAAAPAQPPTASPVTSSATASTGGSQRGSWCSHSSVVALRCSIDGLAGEASGVNRVSPCGSGRGRRWPARGPAVRPARGARLARFVLTRGLPSAGPDR